MAKSTVDTPTRPAPNEMTEREMLEEMLENSRKVTDLVNGFFGDLQSGKINPMSMMMGMMKGR